MSEHNPAAHAIVKQGIYYFRRRVPSDVAHHHKSPKISYSLRTRSASVAAARAARAAQKLDEYWYHLRISGHAIERKPILVRANSVSKGEQSRKQGRHAGAKRIILADRLKPVPLRRDPEKLCQLLERS